MLVSPSEETSGGRRVPAESVEQEREEAVGEPVGVGARVQPRVGPVRRREKEERGGGFVEVGSQLAELAALTEKLADALLVAAPLGDDLVAPLALEVLPLLHEHGRDVELLGDDAKVGAERE